MNNARTFFLSMGVLAVCAVLVLSGCASRIDEVPEYDVLAMSKEAETSMLKDDWQPNTTFSDLVRSIEKKEKIECDYRVVDEDTGQLQKAMIYLEGENYKSITWTTDDKFYSIYDGNTFYSWSDLAKQGSKMASSCAQQFSGSQVNDEDDSDHDLDTFKTTKELFDQEVALNCQPSPFVNLSIPGDVEFADQCELLKIQKEAIEQLRQDFSK